MSRHTGQTSSQSDAHSDELQLAVLTQQNKCQIRNTKSLEVTHYQNLDELKQLLITAQQFKHHYFKIEQQPLPLLPKKASLVSRKAFRSYSI